MAYTFLLGEDCCINASHREVIMQREKCVSEIWFLVAPQYKSVDNDMSLFSVVMEYILPTSRKYHTFELVKDEEGYEEYLKYRVPLDTNLSSESGDVEFQLTFIYVGLDADGKGVQKVRKTKPAKLHITPVAAWSDIIPDSALSVLDQRLIETSRQIKQLADIELTFSENLVDNIKYDDKAETLQLMAGENTVGNPVNVRDMLDDGIPVVDLDSDSGNGSKPNDKPDHNEGCNCEDCSCTNENGNVVEF